MALPCRRSEMYEPTTSTMSIASRTLSLTSSRGGDVGWNGTKKVLKRVEND
jgi:hypothetical protein